MEVNYLVPDVAPPSPPPTGTPLQNRTCRCQRWSCIVVETFHPYRRSPQKHHSPVSPVTAAGHSRKAETVWDATGYASLPVQSPSTIHRMSTYPEIRCPRCSSQYVRRSRVAYPRDVVVFLLLDKRAFRCYSCSGCTRRGRIGTRCCPGDPLFRSRIPGNSA
jgi:hypothetical protein